MPLQADINAAGLCGYTACTAAVGLSADKDALAPVMEAEKNLRRIRFAAAFAGGLGEETI